MIFSFLKIIEKTRGRGILPFVLFAGFLIAFPLNAAPTPAQRTGQYYQDPNATVIKEMYHSLEDMRHEISNHEAEIRMFDEKLTNLDSIIDSVRDQLSDSGKFYKEQLKNSSAEMDARITSLEATSKGLVGDMRLLKTHSNETVAILNQYKQKIGEMEKSIELQNQDIEHLQAAMRSLMEAMQGSSPNSAKNFSSSLKTSQVKNEAADLSNADRTYKVKSGDSLEKIARCHQTTIQAIKDANGLITDRIVVGKTLIIP
jgi:LysM repeat protein